VRWDARSTHGGWDIAVKKKEAERAVVVDTADEDRSFMEYQYGGTDYVKQAYT
jgi:hypothetical protein